jgi:hypothetical protein
MHTYFESRTLPPKPPATLASDIARHMQTRQYLGTTFIICDSPHSILSAVRKQWLKAARHLQNMRASTLNVEEILRLTHAIMHMQNMLFVAKPPHDSPHAMVYFISPDQVEHIPYSCYTLYVTCDVPTTTLTAAVKRLPAQALIVAYNGTDVIAQAGALPKVALEEEFKKEWQQMVAFLHRHQVEPSQLIVGNVPQLGALDDALDTLLGTSNDFLHRAAGFQHAMSLAQPLSIFTADQQRQFEIVVRLAHRVQALSPGTFNSYLLKTFGDSEATTYFLRDVGTEDMYDSCLIT